MQSLVCFTVSMLHPCRYFASGHKAPTGSPGARNKIPPMDKHGQWGKDSPKLNPQYPMTNHPPLTHSLTHTPSKHSQNDGDMAHRNHNGWPLSRAQNSCLLALGKHLPGNHSFLQEHSQFNIPIMKAASCTPGISGEGFPILLRLSVEKEIHWTKMHGGTLN